MVVAVQHHLIRTGGSGLSEVLDQSTIFVQRMDRPSAPIFLRDAAASAGSVKWHDGERHRTPARHLAVGPLELFWRGEETRVVVPDAELHRYPRVANATSLLRLGTMSIDPGTKGCCAGAPSSARTRACVCAVLEYRAQAARTGARESRSWWRHALNRRSSTPQISSTDSASAIVDTPTSRRILAASPCAGTTPSMGRPAFM